jgi:hypothetical protein
MNPQLTTLAPAPAPAPALVPSRDVGPARHTSGRQLGLRLLGAALALGVAYIHVKDQGGFPGDKLPTYVGIGYYLLEAAGLATAIALLLAPARLLRATWALAAGVAGGPLVGFVLSRGPGLPSYTDDRGNWTETLGLVSVVVEIALLTVAIVGFTRRTPR